MTQRDHPKVGSAQRGEFKKETEREREKFGARRKENHAKKRPRRRRRRRRSKMMKKEGK